MSGFNGLSFARDDQAMNVIPDDAVLLGQAIPDDEYSHGGGDARSLSFGDSEGFADPEGADAGERDATDSSPDPEKSGDATDDVMEEAGKLLGMTAEEIGQTPPAVLKRFIEKAKAKQAADAGDDADPDEGSEEDDEAPDEPASFDDGDDWSPEFDREMVDPDAVRAIDQITARFNAELKRLRGEIESTRVSAAESSFDAEMTKLGPEYEDLFGKGPSIGLDPVSGHAKNREKLREEMDRITLGYQAMRQKPPARNEIFAKALRSQFGDKYESITRSKLNGAIQNRQGKFMSRPSVSEETGRDREAIAIANLGERMRAKGML